MAYCRFSSDSFRCHLYVYQSHGGYEIHVAAVKHVGDRPLELPFTEGVDIQKWLDSHNALMKWMETAKREPIGLPYDGQSFSEATPEAAVARLKELKRVGYCFPDYVIDAIREETDFGKDSD